jgi:hypothetical protein
VTKKHGPTKGTSRRDDQPWDIRPVSANAKKQWDEANEREPELIEKVRERLRSRPMDRSDNPKRTHPLKGSLGVKWVGGKQLPVWQHELTGAGRVWYCPDRSAHVVWLVKITLSHPKQTD